MPVAETFFVDSNVPLCYADPVDREKRTRAEDWFNLWMGGAGRLSWQVL